LRRKQLLVTADRRHRFYTSTPRIDKRTGEALTIRPGKQLINRITEAARRGHFVRLTITWKDVIYGTGHRSAQTYHDVPLTLWPEGVNANAALDDLDSVGNYDRDPDAVLANLIYEQDGRVESVQGIVGWQLHTFDPSNPGN
jgi:hypothetical protein